ncbi:hypothetical protein CLOBY_30340 [Clostridium saccharobutylicum]|uniref:hypothetical protein n=1 Tax=Clostridium saccharobutylicum TaxID=169679 RepID=UPI000983A71F|nr:hypothetical protein [Clostridium saccharobutylicum]AQS10885.1 hypothetical protein CLOBY_30340 [Clostridium saccharobutylicum]MBC2436395.1 hypothetical protein [Clostridium saccharobutylicum]NSB88130.1 hypothetical protein [Clostridium saccharobutylicum]NYC31863.1 hypothetical protein [Clostridium saccharobutylicum]OOM19076.1 hypothetical protein CLSAB_01090 [Clostridium saccharobutylicum]
MKILILKKKIIINIIVITCLLFLFLVVFYLTSSKFTSIQTIYPLNFSKDIQYDLTGDGVKDTIETIDGQNQIDFNIKSLDKDYYLSKQINDKILFTINNHWSPKVFIHDISRDSIPEIIIQGSKNNKSVNYIFSWDKKKFSLISSTNKNILGILDCKNTKTPQCYSISSSEGISSLNSFMLINDNILDTTSENPTVPSLDSVTSFINLIEIPYNLDETPDIFTTSINSDELSLLWNLDKDNFSYTFQNAFFYDYEWNNSGEPTAIKWRLSFEKNKLKGSINDKSEFVILVDVVKSNSSYKISSIQKSK